jgi:hypothetical protein
MDQALKAVGIQSKKRFSPAETLAYQRATTRNQGAPLEGDALEKAQTKYRLADAMRDAVVAKDADARKAAAGAINDARKAGTISVDEQTRMVQDAYRYPTRLTATIAHLPLDDALDVYAAAGQQEKKQIRREIASKVQSYYLAVERGKKPYGDYEAMAPRIRKFFADKPA